jgi:tetratricopeptide (TPR) repeat protein
MARSNRSNSTTGASLAQATQLMVDGKTSRAERILRKLIKSDPGNAEALHLAGVARHRAGKSGPAENLVEKAIRAAPQDARFHRTLGDMVSAGGQQQRAAACYRAVIALDPGDAATHGALAGVLMRLDQLGAALESYQTALHLAPDDVATLFGHGNALRAAGRDNDALDAYRAVLALQPHYVPVYIKLGELLRDLGRLDESFQVLQDGAQVKYAPIDLSEDIIRKSAPASDAKLRHDAEQIDYLIERGILAADYAVHAQTYRRLADAGVGKRAATDFYRLPLPERRRVAKVYNRLVHLAPAPRLDKPAVNPTLDRAEIETDYHATKPEITYFDNFLTEEALRKIRAFCLESTIWFTHYQNGYVGAFLGDGFASPLLAQIAEELPAALPDIFGGHKLYQAWAFKYDSRLSGINMHADFAAVNVNFWITPDDALEDKDSGGLVVWDKEAPQDWDFDKYNNDQDAMRRFLADNDAKPVRIAYRQNRALVFNSNLFHETDRIVFREGYENRRINITLLYGRRENA